MGFAVFITNIALLVSCASAAGILYPRASETRDVWPLDGIWNFALGNTTDPIDGQDEEWFRKRYQEIGSTDWSMMPVPASYNDISTDGKVRDHVGLVWYQRSFFVPKGWSGQRVFVRFSSVSKAAEVWVNGEWVVRHDLGHLPFQGEVTSFLRCGSENNITVAVDNILLQTTIPQGRLTKMSVNGRIRQSYNFDYFNYAGIDRPVVLYTTPNTYIDDITIATDVQDAGGIVTYSIDIEGSDDVTVKVSLLDKDRNVVASESAPEGSLTVEDANLWWPYLMDPNPGYLYSLQVELLDSSDDLLDKYSLPVGIRSLSWDSTSMKINNKPIYLRGFGRHEDSDIRGKGLDLSLIIRDHNLIKWVGANAYRTSHYPYAEEILDLADQLGIMIIDECAAVATDNLTDPLLDNHKKSLTELIRRDKNRPGVIMWSAANEPLTQYNTSEEYYRQVIAHVKTLDQSRPVTVVNNQAANKEYSGQFLDIALFNIYEGWYKYAGELDLVIPKLKTQLRQWHEIHNIPVIVAEYGADTLEGLHFLPSYVWSEEFQEDFLAHYFQAFDELREEGFFIGEMIWNFADFATAQNVKRAGGNKKGIFTRNRQPKASAHLLRRRYWALAKYLDNADTPDDLDEYIFRINGTVKDEL